MKDYNTCTYMGFYTPSMVNTGNDGRHDTVINTFDLKMFCPGPYSLTLATTQPLLTD